MIIIGNQTLMSEGGNSQILDMFFVAKLHITLKKFPSGLRKKLISCNLEKLKSRISKV